MSPGGPIKLELTLREKILLALLEYGASPDGFEAGRKATQNGLADVVGVLRPSLIRAVKKLEAEGLVGETKAHVAGEKRRKTVYYLTAEGKARAHRLRESILERPLCNGEGTVGGYIRSQGITLCQALFGDTKTTDEARPLNAWHLPEVSDFVGRERELRTIKEGLENENVSLINVHGIPGIGKTTLVARAVSLYSPFSNVFWGNILPVNSPAAILYDICQFLGGSAEEAGEGLLTGKTDIPSVLKLVERQARREGLLLVFDDLQNANAETTALVKTLAFMALGSTHLKLLVVSRRKERIYDIRYRDRMLALEVRGLTMKAASEMMGNRIPQSRLEEIYRLTGGHPLAIRIAMETDGRITDVSDFLYSEGRDLLGGDALELLGLLSLSRVPCNMDVLGEVMGRPVRDELKELMLYGFVIDVVGDAGTYYRPQDIVSEAVRSNMDGTAARQAHGTLASYYSEMMSRFGDYPEEFVALGTERAYHLIEAGEITEAIETILTVGEAAVVNDYAPLFQLLDSLPADLDEDIATRLSILRADHEARKGNIEDSLRYYRETLGSTLKKRGMSRERVVLYSRMGDVLRRKGEWKKTLEMDRMALKEAEASGDMLALARAHHDIGTSYLRWAMDVSVKGRKKKLQSAAKHLEEAVKRFEDLDMRKAAVNSMVNLARALHTQGKDDSAVLERADKMAPSGSIQWLALKSYTVEKYLEDGACDDARSTLDQMLAYADSDPTTVLVSAVLVAEKCESPEPLITALEKALSPAPVRKSIFFLSTPENTVDSMSLATAFLVLLDISDSSNHREILDIYRKLISIDDLDEERRALLAVKYGSWCASERLYSEAVAEYERAMKLLPKGDISRRAIVLYKTGEALEGRGDMDGARKAYRRCLKLAEKSRRDDLASKCRRRLKAI